MSESEKILFEVYLENGEFKLRSKETADGLTQVGDGASKAGKGAAASQSGFNKMAKGINLVKTAAKGFIALYIVQKVIEIGKAMLKGASDMDNYRIALTNLTGSAENADKLLKKINKFVAKTPFQVDGVVQTTKQLLAFGVAQEDVIPTMRNLGNLAQGNQESFERLAYAYGKVKAKGKASMEELNMLTEAGVPIVQQLADNFGVSNAQLMKMVSNGKVGFEDVNKAVTDLSTGSGKFAGMMAKMSNTLSGKFSTMLDKFTLLLTEIGQGISEPFKELIDAFSDSADEGSLLSDVLKGIGTVLGFVARSVATVARTFNLLYKKAKMAGNAMAAANYESLAQNDDVDEGMRNTFLKLAERARNENKKLEQETKQSWEKIKKIWSSEPPKTPKRTLKTTDSAVDKKDKDNNDGEETKKKMANAAAYYNAVGNYSKAALAEVQANKAKELQNLDLMHQQGLIGHDEYINAKKAIEENYRQQAIVAEASAWQAKQQASENYYRARFGMMSKEWQGTAMIAQAGMSLMNQKNKVLFSIGKAATLANIGMNTAEAVMKGMSYGPYIGIPYAALVGTTSAIQIGQVMKQKPPKPAKVNVENPQVPSFAVGTWEVPRNMTANIHKGEMIVSKPFADSVRSGEANISSGKATGGDTYNIIVQGNLVDTDGLFQAVHSAQKNLSKRSGTTVYTRKSVY